MTAYSTTDHVRLGNALQRLAADAVPRHDEHPTVDDLLVYAAHELPRLQDQRDELLAACEAWIEWFDEVASLFDDLDTDTGAQLALRPMRAALANARGES
jgi:hypothetical protein